ncbi:hypothetical protein J0K78_03170 [Halobacillus sp. GSS1]|uniref:hypothetical protein n=1 Tax=Halobacillus sp. GSS1 TaxID=2815919 RepID=UPI001A8C0CE6|nr:hypothetical protein [Halobacillus sp. GSS1]MBN9653254.1 hypothetical protein [Halobacillus sp. GSS1]
MVNDINKWSFFQLLNLAALITLIILFEKIGYILFDAFLSNGSSIMMQIYFAVAILLTVSFNYFWIYCQVKKSSGNIFHNKFWRNGIKVFGLSLMILILTILVSGFTGDIFIIVEQNRWVMYLMAVLFISITYFMMVSIVSKFENSPFSIIKMSFYATSIMLVISIFMM